MPSIDEKKNEICGNDQFKKLVLHYLEMDNPDYSILLDGSWGAGKTYYIKTFIDQLSSAFVDANFIYYSLNGITNIKSTITSLFCKLLLKFDTESNIIKFLKAIKNSEDSITDFIQDDTAKKIVKACSSLSSDFFEIIMDLSLKYKENLSNSILFLDDLERVSDDIDMTDLLGTLNTYFINNNIKIVYIASEKEIKRYSNYFKEKEKYIRRTYKFMPNKTEIFSSFLAKDIFKQYKSNLLEIFKLVYDDEQPNLRSVKFSCNFIAEVIDMYSEFSNKEDYYSPIIFAYSICKYSEFYAKGNTDKKMLKNAISTYGLRSLTEPESKDAYQKFIDDTASKKETLLVCDSIINHIFDGVLDKTQLAHDLLIPKEEDPIIKLRRDLSSLETDEVKDILNDIVENLKNKKYSINYLASFKEIIIPYCKLLNISNEKVLIDLISDSIFADTNSSDLELFFDNKYIDELSKTPFINQELNEKIDQKYSEYLLRKNSNLINEFLDATNGNYFESDFFYNHKDYFIFSLLKQNKKLDSVPKLKNKQINCLTLIINKNIMHSGNPDYFSSELTPLKELLYYIKRTLKSLKRKQQDIMKINALSSLNDIIEKAIDHISSYMINPSN